MLNSVLNDTGAPCPARTDICIRNVMINTANAERLSDTAKLLAESPLSTIDNTHIVP